MSELRRAIVLLQEIQASLDQFWSCLVFKGSVKFFFVLIGGAFEFVNRPLPKVTCKLHALDVADVANPALGLFGFHTRSNFFDFLSTPSATHLVWRGHVMCGKLKVGSEDR